MSRQLSKNIGVEREMLKSKAWRSLSGTAKTVLLDFYLKRQMAPAPQPGKKRSKSYIIANNGEIEYCYSEAEKKGIPRQTFKRAIDDLIEHGFLEINHQGNGTRKGDKNKYSLVENWRKYGTDEFTYKPRKKNKKLGIGFQKLHHEQKQMQKT